MAHLVSQGGAFDSKRYGRVRLWGSIGFLVTVFVAGAWFEAFGMQQFPTMTIVSLLAVLLSAMALPDLKEAEHAEHASVPVRSVLAQPAVRWFFASAFFHVLSHIGIYVFFSLYLDSLGYSKTWIGVMWAVSVVVEIAWFSGSRAGCTICRSVAGCCCVRRPWCCAWRSRQPGPMCCWCWCSPSACMR